MSPTDNNILMFNDKVVSVSDVMLIDSTTAVSFISCRSKEWREIGKRLAALPRLNTLTAENCDSADNLCIGISGSKSLENIRICKPTVTQNVVASATMASNNYAKCDSSQKCALAML
jgi:hypothetical protein